MAHRDTASSDINELFLTSGQFTTTVKTSQLVGAFATDPLGISYDGADTPWCGTEPFSTDPKLFLTSGQFSGTLKTSVSTTGIAFPQGNSWDGVNMPWIGNNAKLYLQSGEITSTVKTSQTVPGIGFSGISWDETNTPWSLSSKLFVQSGQFSSTIKTSEDVSGVASTVAGITWDGTNTPWSGVSIFSGNPQFFLTSGQFTSTIKTSIDISPTGHGTFDIETNQLNLAALISGTAAAGIDESDIVAGGETIIITLSTGRLNPQGDTWHPDIGGNNSRTQDLIDGLVSSGIEANGWNNVVQPGLDFNDVTRDSDTQVTITLPAFGSYDISIAEVVTVTVPSAALTVGNGPLTGSPVIVVEPQLAAASTDTVWSRSDAPVKMYLQSGQFTSTIKDSEDISGFDADNRSAFAQPPDSGFLDNDDKLYKLSGQFSSTLKTSLDVTAVDADVVGVSWDGTANNNTPIMGGNKQGPFLLSGQFATTIKTSAVFSAIDFIPVGVSYDGTDTPWTGALNLTSFTDKIYLMSGQFTTTLKSSADANSIDTLVNDISYSNTTGHTPWCGAQADKLYLSSGQVSTTLKDSEDVSAIGNPAGIDVNDRFAAAAPLTLTVTGSIISSTTEGDIVSGGKTVVLVLSGDTWEATVGADNAITQALIDGLLSDKNQPNGWNNVVRAGLNAADVDRTSDTIVTITLPGFSTFDISGDETIEVTAPASALTSTATDLVGTPTFDIVADPPPRATPRRVISGAHMQHYITVISPDGISYPMNTPHQFGRWVISDSGKGTPPIDYIIQRGPFQDGATVKDFFLAPRVIQLLIRQEFCDRLDWWDGRAALLDQIRPNRQTVATAAEPLQIEWCRPDGTRRRINAFITEGPRFEPRQLGRWDENAFQEVLRFIAYDPLFFDPTEAIVNFSLGLNANLVFPITFPIQFGSGLVNDSVSITYEGTWATLPTIVIIGPLEDPIITNTTTGEKLEFEIDIAAGRTVTIDLAYGVKTVTDDLGNNLIGNLSADSDLATFHIAPDPEAPNGINVITLTGQNPTGATSVQLRYFTRYFGI